MNEIINLKTMQNDLTVFDQMAVSSAANMKSSFDTQLAGITDAFSATASGLSESFGASANEILTQITNAFIGIDTAAITSNTNASSAFQSLLILLTEGFNSTQIYGSDSFRLLSENIIFSCTEASAGVGIGMQSMCTAIGVMSGDTANIITQNMLGAFSLISAGMILTGTVITGVLEEINSAFLKTSEFACFAFDDIQIIVAQDMQLISDSVIKNNEKAGSSWIDYTSLTFDFIGTFDSVLNILETFGVLNTANAAAQAASTTATIAQTGATATSGTASYAAAGGFLAAGAGVLMMGVGILMTVSAIVLLLSAIGATVAGISLGMISGMISSFKSEKASSYATGGFPSMGQMFIAREAGPELVGTIGSRNAVVNNDQIVESVSSGVYRAVCAALSSGQGSGGKAVITLDKKVLGEFAIGYINGKTRETGLSPILV